MTSHSIWFRGTSQEEIRRLLGTRKTGAGCSDGAGLYFGVKIIGILAACQSVKRVPSVSIDPEKAKVGGKNPDTVFLDTGIAASDGDFKKSPGLHNKEL